MSKASIGDKSYAIGLNWTLLSSNKIAAEIAASSDEYGMKVGFKREIRTQESVRTQLCLADDSDKGLISAAAILADINENILLVEKIDNDVFWLCAVSEGEVLAGGDCVSSASELPSKMKELINDLGDGFQNITICVSDEVSREVDIDGEYEETFSSLLEKSEIKKNNFNKYKIKNVKNGSSPILILGFILVAGFIGYYFTGSEESEMIDIAKVENDVNSISDVVVSQAPIISSKSKEDIKAELLKKAYEEEVQWLKDDLSIDSSLVLSQILHFTATTPKFLGGWSVKEISYSKEFPRHFNIHWEGGTLGTSLTLMKSLKEIGYGGLIEFKLNGKKAISRHKIKEPPKKEINGSILSFIKENKYNHPELMHDLESMHYDWVLSHAEISERPIPITGIDDETEARTRQLSVPIKNVVISGIGVYNAINMGLILNKAATIAINKITFNLEENIKWELIGELYEYQ